MPNPLRLRHLRILKGWFNVLNPFKETGSRSMFQVHDGGPLLLMMSGTLDRESRFACHIRVPDAEALLDRAGSAVSCLWPGLRRPFVVPVSVLEGALSRLTPTSCNQYALKIFQRDGVTSIVPTETRIDQFANAGYLRALAQGGPVGAGVPLLTHSEWQTLVAALEHTRGYDVAVPFNDRKALDRAICDAVRLGRMDVLPASVRDTRADFVDVVATPRGGQIPARLIEVERGGDIRAALHRCHHVLAHLRQAVPPERLPRVTIVADASRKAAFDRYVHEAPFPTAGLTDRCDFRSFEEVYRDATLLLPSIPPRGRPRPPQSPRRRAA